MWNNCWIMLDPFVRLDHQYPSLHLWGPAHLITTLEISLTPKFSTTQSHRLLHPSIHLSLSKIDTHLVFVRHLFHFLPRILILSDWLVSSEIFQEKEYHILYLKKKKVLNILARYHPRKVTVVDRHRKKNKWMGMTTERVFLGTRP